MNTERHLAYVLGKTPLSASRVIINLFTQSAGKRQAVVRIGKKSGTAYYGPLTLLECDLSGKEHQELRRMEAVTLVKDRFQLGASYLGLSLLQHWAALLNQVGVEPSDDGAVFRLVGHCLDALGARVEKGAAARANFYFEAWLLHLSGVLPRALPRPEGSVAPDVSPALADERTLRLILAPTVLRAAFQQTAATFVTQDFAAGEWRPSQAAMGGLWRHFLGGPSATGDSLRALLSGT